MAPMKIYLLAVTIFLLGNSATLAQPETNRAPEPALQESSTPSTVLEQAVPFLEAQLTVTTIQQENSRMSQYDPHQLPGPLGHGNLTRITQLGDQNFVLLQQFGQDNAASVRLNGNGNLVDALQYGNRNRLDVSVLGNDNQIPIRQLNDGNALIFELTNVDGYRLPLGSAITQTGGDIGVPLRITITPGSLPK